MIRLLTFDTTHHALWAEQLALDSGLGVQVVPAPADADAKCDLALEFLPEEEATLIEALSASSIPFQLYVR
ncbi:MAG: DUF3343 domain-containing protein [Longimicrobiales bacterium]